MTEEDVSGAAHVSQSLKKVLDKLMFIGLKARGIFESRRDVSP